MSENIYDNIPYKDIEEYVECDLEIYSQDNPAPLSLTVLYEDGGKKKFRHYELGPIVGYVLIGDIPDDDSSYVSTMISEVHEDDENWFAPNTPTYMAGSWMNDSLKTLQRMHKWYHEHIKEGFYDGKWVSKIIKEIVEEEIFDENGLSSCPVLGGPSNE